MTVTIQKADNGYVITYIDSDSDVGWERIEVYESFNPCGTNALIMALYSIVGNLGDLGTKHDKHRVEIKCKCK